MKLSAGYVREADSRENVFAVRWWYVSPRDLGYFATGGRVRTAREARRAIERARRQDQVDAVVGKQMQRPHFRLLPDGDLKLIPR